MPDTLTPTASFVADKPTPSFVPDGQKPTPSFVPDKPTPSFVADKPTPSFVADDTLSEVARLREFDAEPFFAPRPSGTPLKLESLNTQGVDVFGVPVPETDFRAPKVPEDFDPFKRAPLTEGTTIRSERFLFLPTKNEGDRRMVIPESFNRSRPEIQDAVARPYEEVLKETMPGPQGAAAGLQRSAVTRTMDVFAGELGNIVTRPLLQIGGAVLPDWMGGNFLSDVGSIDATDLVPPVQGEAEKVARGVARIMALGVAIFAPTPQGKLAGLGGKLAGKVAGRLPLGTGTQFVIKLTGGVGGFGFTEVLGRSLQSGAGAGEVAGSTLKSFVTSGVHFLASPLFVPGEVAKFAKEGDWENAIAALGPVFLFGAMARGPVKEIIAGKKLKKETKKAVDDLVSEGVKREDAELMLQIVREAEIIKKMTPEEKAALEGKIIQDVQAVEAAATTPSAIIPASRELGGVPTPKGAPPSGPESLSEPNPQARADLFKSGTKVDRKLTARMHGANRIALRWMKDLNEEQRNDLGAYVEGIRNLSIKGDTIDAVESRMTPIMRKHAAEYRVEVEKLRQEINKEMLELEGTPDFLNYVENYLAHFYKSTNAEGKSVGELYTAWSKTSPHAKKRVFPTLAEAVQAKFEPLTQDVAYLFTRAAENNYKMLRTREFLADIKKASEAAEKAGLGKLLSSKKLPGWTLIEHPALRRVSARTAKRFDKGPASEVPPESLKKALKIGQLVIPSDRNNVGTIVSLYSETNSASVSFHNKKTGLRLTKTFKLDQLRSATKAESKAGAKVGKTILSEGPVWVHPDIARPIKILLDRPFDSQVWNAMTAINAAGKGINIAFSLFHEGALFESSQGVNARFLSPLRGIVIGPFEAKRLGLGNLPMLTHRAGLKLAEIDPAGARDGFEHGLTAQRSAAFDYGRQTTESLMRRWEANLDNPFPNHTKVLRKGLEAYNRHLWDNVYVGLKLFTYNTLVREIVPQFALGISVRDIKERIASELNDAFGGQERLLIPTVRRGKLAFEPMTPVEKSIAYNLMFAPDWTMSAIRVAGRPIINFRDPIQRKLGLRYWRNISITLMGSMVLAQQAIYRIFGDDDPDLKPWIWENEPEQDFSVDVTPIVRSVVKFFGGEPSGERAYAKPGKQVREVYRWAAGFPGGLIEQMGAKSSVGIRTLYEQLGGHSIGSGFPMPWASSVFRDELEGWDRIVAQSKQLASQFVPFAWSSTNFAFALPKRKGMTPHRAIRHYKQAIEYLVDPSLWEKIEGGDFSQRQGAVRKILRDIDDAARANGIDKTKRKVLFGNARGKVKSVYYRRFYAIYDDPDKKSETEKLARILARLNASRDDLRAALIGRGATRQEARQGASLLPSRDRFLDYRRTVDSTRQKP